MLKLKLQYFGYVMRSTASLEKTLMLGKIEDAEKGTTEDEMVGWHHWLDGHEFEQALEVGDGQGGLSCCCPWGHKESDTTGTELNWLVSQQSFHHCWRYPQSWSSSGLAGYLWIITDSAQRDKRASSFPVVRTFASWLPSLHPPVLITRLDTYLTHSKVLWEGLHVDKKFSFKKCIFSYLVPGTRYQVENCKLKRNDFWKIFLFGTVSSFFY